MILGGAGRPDSTGLRCSGVEGAAVQLWQPRPSDPSPEPAPWAVLIGVQDPGLVADWSASVPRLLVVQPNPLLAERLLDAWDGQLPSGLEIETEPLALQPGPICWYSYNDSRLDGTTAPDSLRPIFPNLALRGQTLRTGQSLQQLLAAWWQRSGDPGGSGVLQVPADGFEVAVRSAGQLIDRFERLQVHPGGRSSADPAAEVLSDPLQQWLESFCFSPVTAEHRPVGVWRRDHFRLLQRRFEQQQAENGRLLEQHQAWLQEREQMQRAFELLHQRLDALTRSDSDPGEASAALLLGSWSDWQS